MSKIEYDNFPKFLVSAGIVLFALPIVIVHFFLQENSVLLISEQELSQLSSTASQVIIAKQNLCLWLTNNIWILSIVCILCGVVLLILGCKMWYSRQKKTDAKQDLDLQTAEAQYKKMTMEEKDEKIANEVLALERPNMIEGSPDDGRELSVEEIQMRQAAIRKENRLIYSQITQRYKAVEKAVSDRIKEELGAKYEVQDNIKINNLEYDLIAISKNPDLHDYIFEIKYSFSKNSWNSSTFHYIPQHMADQATNYKASTGRKAAAILLVVTLEDQVTQIESMLIRRMQKLNPAMTIRVIAENKIGLLNAENIL